jgi:4-amino-4-deoxy-L-arabinose transferase-like glycosyltransferase
MRRKNELIFLLLLFLLTLGVRISLISQGPYHYDSLELLIASQKTLATHQLQYMHGAGYPLTVLTGAFFLLVFGHSFPVFAINLIGVVFSSACVLALYYLVRRLLSVEAAFFSAALFSFMPGLLSVSIYGINVPVSLFFILLSASFMAKAASGKGNFNLCWSGLCLGAAAGCRLPDAIMFLPMALLFFSSVGVNRRSLKDFVVFFAAPFAAVPALLYYPMFARGEQQQLLTIASRNEMGKFLGLFSKMLGDSSAAFVALAFPPVIVSAMGGLLFIIKEGRKRLFYFFVAWTLVPFFYYANISTVEPRMLVIAAVPCAALAGFFLTRFFIKIPVAALLLLAVICGAMFFAIYPTLEFRHANNLQEQFGRWVRKNTPQDAVIISNDEWLFLNYYAHRRPLHKPWDCDSLSSQRFREAIDKELSAGRRVFVLQSVLATDFCGVFRKGPQQKYDFSEIGRCQNENWHHNCLDMQVNDDRLLELKIK